MANYRVYYATGYTTKGCLCNSADEADALRNYNEEIELLSEKMPDDWWSVRIVKDGKITKMYINKPKYVYNPAIDQIKGDMLHHFYSEIRKLCEEIRLEKRATTAFDVGEIYGYQMAIAYIRKYFHEEESTLDSNSEN